MTARSGGRRRSLALLVVGLCPWSVLLAGGEVTLVAPLGLVDPAPPSYTSIYHYTFMYTRGLPSYLLAWPLGVALYVGGVASALGGDLLGREDHRVTAALVAMAGLTQLSLAWGFSRQPGRVALPVGTVLCLAAVWWFEWPALGLSGE